jgi:hypothetical protein
MRASLDTMYQVHRQTINALSTCVRDGGWWMFALHRDYVCAAYCGGCGACEKSGIRNAHGERGCAMVCQPRYATTGTDT